MDGGSNVKRKMEMFFWLLLLTWQGLKTISTNSMVFWLPTRLGAILPTSFSTRALRWAGFWLGPA